MSDYTRHLAELRGTIEARDIRPGDVIATRCPGDIIRTPHRVAIINVEPGGVTLHHDDGHASEHTPGMPVSLISLAESAQLSSWQIGGAL